MLLNCARSVCLKQSIAICLTFFLRVRHQRKRLIKENKTHLQNTSMRLLTSTKGIIHAHMYGQTHTTTHAQETPYSIWSLEFLSSHLYNLTEVQQRFYL